MRTECRERKGLGEDVGALICRSYIEESSMSVFYKLSTEMIPDINVFRPSVMSWINRKEYAAIVELSIFGVIL